MCGAIRKRNVECNIDERDVGYASPVSKSVCQCIHVHVDATGYIQQPLTIIKYYRSRRDQSKTEMMKG